MAPQNDREKLGAAWRALAGGGHEEGWRTIPVRQGGRGAVLAGRHFPDDREAILVEFASARLPATELLPQGRGFNVARVTHLFPDKGQDWIALSRQSDGNIDMFTMMVEDVFGVLRVYDHLGDESLLSVFLGRISAWQQFMLEEKPSLLGSEAEVGLYGELCVLEGILDANLPAKTALEGWLGPLRGLQDFEIGTGAIETKTTTAASSFPARVASLEQLDPLQAQPLFLACTRLSVDLAGSTLPEKIKGTLDRFGDDPGASGLFENLISRAGFMWATSDKFTRRFVVSNITVLRIDEDFPSLTRGKVHPAIQKARYEIDIDLVGAPDFGLQRAIEELRGG